MRKQLDATKKENKELRDQLATQSKLAKEQEAQIKVL